MKAAGPVVYAYVLEVMSLYTIAAKCKRDYEWVVAAGWRDEESTAF